MYEGWYFGECDDQIEKNISEKESGNPHLTKEEILMQKSILHSENEIEKSRVIGQTNEETNRHLIKNETTIKFGMFCLTFMYFRALHMIKNERHIWGTKQSSYKGNIGCQLSEERKIMQNEAANAQRRKYLSHQYDSKANIGRDRLQRKEYRQHSERVRKSTAIFKLYSSYILMRTNSYYSSYNTI